MVGFFFKIVVVFPSTEIFIELNFLLGLDFLAMHPQIVSRNKSVSRYLDNI